MLLGPARSTATNRESVTILRKHDLAPDELLVRAAVHHHLRVVRVAVLVEATDEAGL